MCVCVFCVSVFVCNSNSVSVSRRVATVSPGDGLWCQSVAAAHNKSVITELEKPERERVVLNSPFLFHIVLLFHIVFYFLQSLFSFPPQCFHPFSPSITSTLFSSMLCFLSFIFFLPSINPFGPLCFCPFPLLCLYIHRVLPYFTASCFHFLNLPLLSTFPYTPIPSPSASLLHFLSCLSSLSSSLILISSHLICRWGEEKWQEIAAEVEKEWARIVLKWRWDESDCGTSGKYNRRSGEG